ncbi:Phosphotransferase system cellobiose-specific component IIC [Raoultella terrigena]|uniref:Phosphotransferase system cellobiose-specific component IIC n=1 Tax=Raoultella terrigena TaxID=577 RepID=A0A4U9D0S5_RAOTE|nr:Phosphotransferase system cellobiose-specific component IIC [Raoultella terrigena]
MKTQQALASGAATLPHIYLQGFWDFYLLIGGIGSTLPLVFMAMRSRSRQLKAWEKSACCRPCLTSMSRYCSAFRSL